MKQLFPRLCGAKGIVFDVRGYPTINFDFLGHISDNLLKSDHMMILVTRFPNRRGVIPKDDEWSLRPRKPQLTAKLAFLIDAKPVSAGETFLSLVAEHNLAPIVGGPTAGSNGGVNVYALPGGYRVSWTGMKVLKKDGSRLHGVGVLPTVAVSRTIKGLAAGRDEVLDRAVELIQN
jgi:C-terminal processing protease CtpA/Prc